MSSRDRRRDHPRRQPRIGARRRRWDAVGPADRRRRLVRRRGPDHRRRPRSGGHGRDRPRRRARHARRAGPGREPARPARWSVASRSLSTRSGRRAARSSGPPRMAWVGPETVTSMIEAHGPAAGALLTPTFDEAPGWPVLLPLEALPALRAVGTGPDAAGDPGRTRRGRRAAAAHRPRRPRHDARSRHAPIRAAAIRPARPSPPAATSTSGAR